MIPLLQKNSLFPPLAHALKRPNGLLAAGGDLAPSRLLEAYRHGIFPWFSADEPILWWSPDPRMVLFPSEFNISHSLRKTLRKGNYQVKTDTDFEAVMRACAVARDVANPGGYDTARDNFEGESSRLAALPAPEGSASPCQGGACDTARDNVEGESSRLAALPAPEGSASPCQGGTWIVEEMIKAYCELHLLGHAHSVEVWIGDELAGGLYGVGIGRMFFGESMFSRRTDASKIALAHLARQLERWNFGLIDCQMYTPHLSSLGAREIPRAEFVARLQELINCEPVKHFQFDTDLFR